MALTDASSRILDYRDVVVALGGGADREPVLVHWPSEHLLRDELARAGLPRLLLVEPGARPPDVWAADEDWVHSTADGAERDARMATLRGRVAALRQVPDPRELPRIDADGLIRRGAAWVALPPVEMAVVTALVADLGRTVERDRLAAAAWPNGASGTRAVDGCIRRIRPKLAPLGLVVHGISGRGYLLDVND